MNLNLWKKLRASYSSDWGFDFFLDKDLIYVHTKQAQAQVHRVGPEREIC